MLLWYKTAEGLLSACQSARPAVSRSTIKASKSVTACCIELWGVAVVDLTTTGWTEMSKVSMQHVNTPCFSGIGYV
jgi:hypothetical protein